MSLRTAPAIIVVAAALVASRASLESTDYAFANDRAAYVLNLVPAGTQVIERATGAQTIVPFGARMTFAGHPKFSKHSAFIVRHIRAHLDSYQPWELNADLPVDVLVTGAYYTYGPGGWDAGGDLVDNQSRFPDRPDKVVLAYVNSSELTAIGRWDPSFNPAWDRDGDAVIDPNAGNLPPYVDRNVFNASWKAYVAAYWTESWRQQLGRRIDWAARQHFDGVMLDVMTGHWTWRQTYPSIDLNLLRQRTADLFRWASQYAKTTHGSAFVVSANIDPDVRTYFPDLGAYIDSGYYQNAFFEWTGSGVVNGSARSLRADVFSNPIVDFARSQGLAMLNLDHLGTGAPTPGLNFVDYNDRITDAKLLEIVRWALESGSTPQVAPLFFDPPYAFIPRFVRVVPGTASLTNTAYRDWVLGSDGRDTIATGAADDLIAGGGGHDLIDGGPETNTAFYYGPRSNYSIGLVNGVLTVSDLTGREGTDTLTNIHFLQFADQRIAVGDGSVGSGARVVTLQPPVISGSSVTLQWTSPEGSVTEYVLEAGSAAGASDLYNASVGTSTQLTATVPPGTYFVRVRARVGGSLSGPSNEVSFTLGGPGSGCAAPPPAPQGLSGSVLNGVASVRWTPVPGATSYIVQAGSLSGTADLFNGSVGGGVNVSSPVAPGFRAYVRVVAVNVCGQSAASPEIVIE